MKKLIILFIVCAVVSKASNLSAQVKEGKGHFVSLTDAIEDNVFLNKKNRYVEDTLPDRTRSIVPEKFLSSPAGYAAFFFEDDDGLIKLAATDFEKMKSDGYKGVRQMYDAYAIENRDNKDVYLNLLKGDSQEGFVIHIRGGRVHNFVLENSKYTVSGYFYSYSADEEASLKFMKKFVNSLKLKL